jgi:hypothetical protein
MGAGKAVQRFGFEISLAQPSPLGTLTLTRRQQQRHRNHLRLIPMIVIRPDKRPAGITNQLGIAERHSSEHPANPAQKHDVSAVANSFL